MDEGTNITVAAAQRHIIERPRLTKLLDESTARVILLVAPAGYGKTTLARQWMATHARPFAWYECGSEASDIAGFAVGLARAAKPVCPDASNEIRNFLVGRTGAADALGLIETVIDALDDWPVGYWLAIDDYHASADSRDRQSLVRAVADSTSIPLIIASRIRPAWVSARNVLYGSVKEVNQTQLSMSEEEAREILVDLDPASVSSLSDLAGGWPAVLGLAALTKTPLQADKPPAELHEFFAEELYGSLSTNAKQGLTILSVSPQISAALSRDVLGASGEAVIAEGVSKGFLSLPSAENLTMHPLLRAFFQSKGDLELEPGKRRVAEYLLKEHQWDDAFAVISNHALADLLSPLLRASSAELLRAGRGATLATWLDQARRSGVSDPFLRVAASELAFQEGNNREASRLADEAIAQFSESDSLVWRAWFDRAQSAYFSEDVDLALKYFARARDLADEPRDKQEALWGALCCANYGARPQANELVAEFVSLRDESLEFAIRLATARATNASIFGGIDEALDLARATAPMLDSIDDVMITSAFRHAWISALTLNARYQEAEVVLADAQAEAETRRLLFAMDMIDSQRAGVEAGKGRYARAAALAERVEAAASKHEDLYLLIAALMHRARLGALSPDPLRVDIPHVAPIATGAYSEYLSAMALLRAAQGDADAALSYADKVEAMISTIDAKVLAALVRAIVAHQCAEPSATVAAKAAFELALASGAYDPFVYAYRVCNPLLGTVLMSGAPVETIAAILHRAGDRDLARRFNLGRPRDYTRNAELTPREDEVLRLVARGLTNREIAETLFVSPVTVKVHLRHIYEKLGVRSRTEAALRAQARNLI